MENRKKVKKYCKMCGTLLVLNNTRDIKRKNFCSRRCSTIYYQKEGIAGMKGKQHSEEAKTKISQTRIKNGHSAGKNNPRYLDGRTTFRKRLLKTKDYECIICGSTKYLIAHHVNPCVRTKDRSRSIIDGDHSTENGEFICASCHKTHHLEEKRNVTSAA